MRAEHLMGCVAMQEKCLEKQRQEPVRQKEDQNYHLFVIIGCKIGAKVHINSVLNCVVYKVLHSTDLDRCN